MKKRKLKPFIKKSIIGILVLTLIIGVSFLFNSKTLNVFNNDEDYIYVNDYIFDNYYPVINQDEKLLKPFQNEKVVLYKSFYDEDSNEEEQKNSIVYYEGTYMQNSGLDYKSDEEFDVVASISGTVTNINDDTLLGTTVEIRNSTEIIVLYQSLNDVSVKKGDTITQGQIIGKSGSCPLNSDVKNGLHFEMYKNGTVINPLKYFDKSIKELTTN